MEGGETILFSAQGEVWGLTESLMDDLMANCSAVQAACPQPFSPLTCDETCLDQLPPGHTKEAISEIKRVFDGSVCPTGQSRWAPNLAVGGRLIDLTPFIFEEHGMPPFGTPWCIVTTIPRANIFEAIDQVHHTSHTYHTSSFS